MATAPFEAVGAEIAANLDANRALRPENVAADPALAVALRDFEWLAMGSASFVMAGLIASLAVLVRGHGVILALSLVDRPREAR